MPARSSRYAAVNPVIPPPIIPTLIDSAPFPSTAGYENYANANHKNGAPACEINLFVEELDGQHAYQNIPQAHQRISIRQVHFLQADEPDRGRNHKQKSP